MILPLWMVCIAVQFKLTGVETFLTSGCWSRLQQIVFGEQILG